MEMKVFYCLLRIYHIMFLNMLCTRSHIELTTSLPTYRQINILPIFTRLLRCQPSWHWRVDSGILTIETDVKSHPQVWTPRAGIELWPSSCRAHLLDRCAILLFWRALFLLLWGYQGSKSRSILGRATASDLCRRDLFRGSPSRKLTVLALTSLLFLA